MGFIFLEEYLLLEFFDFKYALIVNPGNYLIRALTVLRSSTEILF